MAVVFAFSGILCETGAGWKIRIGGQPYELVKIFAKLPSSDKVPLTNRFLRYRNFNTVKVCFIRPLLTVSTTTTSPICVETIEAVPAIFFVGLTTNLISRNGTLSKS